MLEDIRGVRKYHDCSDHLAVPSIQSKGLGKNILNKGGVEVEDVE